MTIIDYLKRGLDIWVCMDALNNIVQVLLVVHHAWKSRGVHIRYLANFLLDLDDERYLDAVDRQGVVEDVLHFCQVFLLKRGPERSY